MTNIDEKRARFKRLAAQRTTNVVTALRILGNCGNRSTYEYTDEEVRKIFDEVEHSVEEAKDKFQSQRDRKFRL